MKTTFKFLLIFLLAVSTQILPGSRVMAQENPSIGAGADLCSRYVWRGLDIGNTPSIQPSLAIGYSGLELGVWGAYTISNNESETDEIDTWLSYNYQFENSIGLTIMLTDYYLPNAGVKWGNFNDYDDPDGAGAHLLEAGVGISGPDNFPVSFFAYMNIYNDEGNNAYFQVDYATGIEETDINLFIGAAGGSEENPDYYGTDNFQIINMGITVDREIKMTDNFSLPTSISFIANPNLEMTYLMLSISL